MNAVVNWVPRKVVKPVSSGAPLRIAMFEFTVFQGIFPLASGYLQAAASADPQLAQRFTFQKFSMAIDHPEATSLMGKVDAEIYTFSCYVWNMGLVRRWIRYLAEHRPHAWIILGGPQVMHRAHLYLESGNPRMLVCNGEGERIFPNILRQIGSEDVDFSEVRGVSFYDGDTLTTTPEEERIRSLDEIPSPYLTGIMDPRGSVWAVLETNRGCPFRCTYCYWGAATNAKVNKYELQRILDEITWCSENGVMYIFIADANFGMLQRDVEIAEHLAACAKRTGSPTSVSFSSSKNTPDRVAEIARIFANGGLVSTHPISLQTMNKEALKAVKRDNIKTESYEILQSVLNQHGISSFLEMIWPLPGETYESFLDGIGELCHMGADSFIFYPLMLIGNVEMEKQVEEYDMQAIDDPDVNSEARIVIATRSVSHEDYLNGVRATYHVTALYSLRGLWHVGRYLSEVKGIRYAEQIARFTEFCQGRKEFPYVAYMEETISTSQQYRYSAVGGVLHNILHAAPAEFDALCLAFLKAQGWLDEEVQLRLDLDILNRPHIYSNTRLHIERNLKILSVVKTDAARRVVDVPARFRHKVLDILGIDKEVSGRIAVNYQRGQMPFMKGKSLHDNFSYCQDRLHKMRSILPSWTSA